jgi:hypothetical protein
LKIQIEEAKRIEEVMKIQMMKKEEEVEKLEEEIVTLRSKIIKLIKNIEETETSTSSVENEEKHYRAPEKKMKKRVRVMQKHSKEGIMVKKNQRRIIEINIQQDQPHSRRKEASTIMKRSIEENVMIIQGWNSEALHNKEYHPLPGM